MTDTHTTAHIPDEAVQAAVKAYSKQMDYNDNHVDAVKASITSAIPYLSAPCAVEGNDSGLVNYFKKMQEAAANYIEPTTYKKRFPKDSSKHSTEFKMPHEHHAVSQKHIEEVKRDRAFIDDIIYFLDCPEERRILSNVVTKPIDAPTKEERHANTARNLIINQTSTDLEQIINGHDPEQSILNNDVWDRLDKMACEIEALTKPVDVAAVLEALEIIANPIKHFEESAKKAGDHLDGHTAIALSSDANWLKGIAQKALDTIRALSAEPAQGERKYKLGDRLTKTRGSKWTGRVVGFYSTNLTPIGYAIESETETGSVQIYPEAALTAAPTTEEGK